MLREVRMRLRGTFIIAAICSLLFVNARAGADIVDCAGITTDKGLVSGVADEKSGVCSYKGIPFAAPPVGELRFVAPAEPSPWDETLTADEFGPVCTQFPMGVSPSKNVVGSEDCLYLNVFNYAPEVGTKRPVMFFVHGGGFVTGSGTQDLYDGVTLARRGKVLVVTINYRLGPFGFIAHPALRDEKGFSGNYGMLDQIAALKWVMKNIAEFGGDPGNVTIFGESAGAMSVGALMASPLAKGLFHKAIVESGPVMLINVDVKAAEAKGLEGAALLGCDDPETAAKCLRGLDAKAVMATIPPVLNFIAENESEGNLPYLPVSGTDFLPEDPMVMFYKGDFNQDVPLMLGSNKDEASYFTMGMTMDNPEQYRAQYKRVAAKIKETFNADALTEELLEFYPLDDYKTPKLAYNDIVCDVGFTCPTRMLAQMVSEKQRDVYLYHFTKNPDEKGLLPNWGAFHGSELAFVFGNFSFMGIKFSSKKNRVLSKKMIAYWSSFARDGVPDVKGLPEWPRYTGENNAYLELGVEIHAGSDLKKARCDYLIERYLESAGVEQ